MKNQTFGIELEMRHISRADAAAVIAAHFGTRVSHTGGGYDTREIPDGTGRVWKVVKDSKNTPVSRGVFTIWCTARCSPT